jgi:hypothetical protein
MTFNQLVETIEDYKTALHLTGKRLGEAKENYKELVGEGIDTWADFVQQSEIGLTVREANSLIKLANWMEVVELPLDHLNLSTARFCSLRGITDESLIEDMMVLSLKDFKEAHADLLDETGVKKRTGEFEYLVFKRDKDTNSLSKVHGVSSEIIKEKLEIEDEKM